ncbi:MAG: 4-(cytidine 5'-diphospho)-2-C-methyl-D-erythritol kinase [Actinomycetia bacterium]|nr:4-(cytidine 5'-diphospho)-2-C-methyl-D-erythritol kinase [Actinomycetes bacterium]
MHAEAFAKVNLSLVVYAPSADGYHPLSGVFQSVSWFDTVSITDARIDEVTVSNDEAPSDESNLAFKAVDAVRRMARVSTPVSVRITKRIPSGAGLGGGSADAAAALGLMAGRYGIDDEQAADIAESLGADVPFSYVGGSARVEGRGERLTAIAPMEGFALAIVVPPFSLSTPEVFRRWDSLGGPTGEMVPEPALPPRLRGGMPVRNDLYPAAVALDPRIADWRAELSRTWGAPVAMTGSGSALFSFFSTLDEARDAVDTVDLPTRATEAVVPVDHGWERMTEGR